MAAEQSGNEQRYPNGCPKCAIFQQPGPSPVPPAPGTAAPVFVSSVPENSPSRRRPAAVPPARTTARAPLNRQNPTTFPRAASRAPKPCISRSPWGRTPGGSQARGATLPKCQEQCRISTSVRHQTSATRNQVRFSRRLSVLPAASLPASKPAPREECSDRCLHRTSMSPPPTHPARIAKEGNNKQSEAYQTSSSNRSVTGLQKEQARPDRSNSETLQDQTRHAVPPSLLSRPSSEEPTT